MKAYSFVVTIAAEALDTEVVEDTIKQSIIDGLPDDTMAAVKSDGVKQYSEQGWKVARHRRFGITAKQAGDAHNAKKIRVESSGSTLVVESEKADALLPGV